MSSTKSSVSFDETASAFDSLTTAAQSHDDPPFQHIHAPAHLEAHKSWFARLVPEGSLQAFESAEHLGNYVVHRDTGAKEFEAMSLSVRLGMHLLYYGSGQEELLHSKRVIHLLEEQSRKMGANYDTPESAAHIPPFIRSFGLEQSMTEMVIEDPAGYRTFNDFFAREIKPAARPVAEPADDDVTSSPADCRLSAFPTIELATRYWIKGAGFTVARLLGDDDLARTFDAGSIVIARLAPQDYHRWHAPVSGVVESVHEIPGAYYTVNPQAVCEPGILSVFTENRRSVMVVKRRGGSGGRVAIIAVGAMLVGSIFYLDGIDRPGAEITRGQCMGGFKYGGSTVIVLYPKGDVQLDADLVKNSTEIKCETLMKVGWRVGGTATGDTEREG